MPEELVESQLSKQVPLDWQIPENLETHFATNIVVQHTEGGFFFTFFEVILPFVLGDQVRLAAIESVPARAVARIAISSDRMEAFVQAMQRILEKSREKKVQEGTVNGS